MTKKWGISIKKESESLDFTGLKIPRDYFKDKGGGVKPHYLTFYSTFGGLNSSFGSINEIELELSRDNTEIYFNRPGGGYELVLKKDIATDEWIRPTN